MPDLVAPERAARARPEVAAYLAFLRRFELDDSAEAVVLYLAALDGRDLKGRAIRERLQLIDLDRRLRGLAPWHQDPDVKTFLRGLFSSKPVGEKHSHYDPLYLELVHAMVDACRTPTEDGRRALAGMLLRDGAGLSVSALSRLRWSDVWVGRDRVEINVTTKVGRGPARTVTHQLNARRGTTDCPVAAIRTLRPLGGGEFVFGIDGRQFDVNKLSRMLTQPEPTAPMANQVRDAALLLIGYAACLRTNEAKVLRQSDVERHDKGMVLTIAGRSRLTFIPSAPDPAYDPWTAWDRWLGLLEQRGLRAPDGHAFMPSTGSVIFDKPLHESGLNKIVHDWSDEAGLSGRHVWTSLRTGMMRTAVRNEARSYSIAAHADLVSLASVARHERRENLLGDGNVAGRLGL
ncbi:hypothetical protein [Nocardioides jejuensis]|uniref:Tyr recombinase domain-containing protein n=1 Tax=Nocardioides jejuensis TaxID=2502782 RepID=A0A4R1BUQ0_9ACTN|nr:hypothetical protein [Nocardioides jejuensis]TCJ21660.1 hypothetical protein EPD65_14630 [Nocardioides jejuensis]